MDVSQIDLALRATLEDARLSRGERQALGGLMDDTCSGERDLDMVRSRAFAIAAEQLPRRRSHHVLAWLEGVVKLVESRRATPPPAVLGEVHFSPGEDCVRRLTGLISGSGTAIDVCVFTITDDRIASALLEAHHRGVCLRVLSDNVKSSDLGSDIDRLEAAGIAVAVDRGPGHMHHKFAVVDRRTVVAGSYNWTRAAAEENHENLLVSDHPELVARFSAEFDRLWQVFGPVR